MTDGVLSDIVTISVLIPINTYDKADQPTSKAGSTGPQRTTKKKTDKTISQLWKSLCQAYSLLVERPIDSYTLQQVRRVRPVPSIDG